MTPPVRRLITLPPSHVVDEAPQLLVVALADAALLALERALDSAHPLLASTRRHANAHHPLLLSTERLAIQLLEATSQLAPVLREYLDSVHFDLQDRDDDPLDPF
jgi:hypothetical protein